MWCIWRWPKAENKLKLHCFPAGMGWGLCFLGQWYMPHVLGSIQKWKKTFQHLVLPMNSRGFRGKKKIIFLKILISNLDKNELETHWNRQWKPDAPGSPPQAAQTAPPRLSCRAQLRLWMTTHIQWGLITAWSYAEGSTKTRAQALHASNTQSLHEMFKNPTVRQKGWRHKVRLFLPRGCSQGKLQMCLLLN